MKKAFVVFPCQAQERQRLEELAADRCEFIYKEETLSREAYLAAMEQAEIILGEPRREDLSLCRKLQWMQSTSSGVNYYLDGNWFPEQVLLSCMTGCYGNIIAEHLLAMVLSLCRRLPEYRDQQHQHKWQLRKYDKQLEGATLMILGAGDIGTTVAKWMRPMVGKIIGVRRVAREFPSCYDEMITLDELDEKLGEADILVCALPHTPETVHLLNEDRLRKMKPDAVLVNGGRGSLIDQDALCRVLEEGHLWGVGLEVAFPEPLPEDHPLWDAPRTIITPHSAGNSFAVGSPQYHKLWDYMFYNLSRFLEGEVPENLVDFQTGYRRTL